MNDEDPSSGCNESPPQTPPLHVMNEAVAQARIYGLMCSQKWKTESTNFGTGHKA
jgi:hypothetical protein